jgi:hypothetical protein
MAGNYGPASWGSAGGYTFTITVEVDGAEEFIDKCMRSIGVVNSRAPIWLAQAAESVQRHIQVMIQQRGLVDTGALYNSGSVTSNGLEAEVKFGGGDVDYAAALEFGAAPHPIPASGGVVAFQPATWDNGGPHPLSDDGWFVGRVNHPGNPPFGYGRAGARAAVPSVLALLGKELMTALETA